MGTQFLKLFNCRKTVSIVNTQCCYRLNIRLLILEKKDLCKDLRCVYVFFNQCSAVEYRYGIKKYCNISVIQYFVTAHSVHFA